MAGFDSATVREFAGTEEIEVEAAGSGAGARIRTPIWVVVAGDDVYIRAVRGKNGRWYRSVMSDPRPAVVLHGKHVRVRPVPVRESAEIERASEAYRQKYADSPWLGGVLKPHTLEATLRIEPA